MGIPALWPTHEQRSDTFHLNRRTKHAAHTNNRNKRSTKAGRKPGHHTPNPRDNVSRDNHSVAAAAVSTDSVLSTELRHRESKCPHHQHHHPLEHQEQQKRQHHCARRTTADQSGAKVGGLRAARHHAGGRFTHGVGQRYELLAGEVHLPRQFYGRASTTCPPIV